MKHLLAYIITATMALLLPESVAAFTTDHYAAGSVLAQGRWVKIKVPRSGLYRISPAMLKSLGFTAPSRVRIHGYGGRRISDVLSTANYVDDLPATYSELTDKGIVFYAHGPGEWTEVSRGRYHYVQNIYTTDGYYFITEAPEDSEAPAAEPTGTPGKEPSAATYFTERVHHEQELTLAADHGPALVGEDFRFKNRHDITFRTPGAIKGEEAWVECSFISTLYKPGKLLISANGKELANPTLPQVKPPHGNQSETISRNTFAISEESPETTVVSLSLSTQGTPARANLNYLSLNYRRKLEIPASGYLEFTGAASAYCLGNASADTRIWEISNDGIKKVNCETNNNEACWTMPSAASKHYAAWTPAADLPSPEVCGNVYNQDLHSLESHDMLIVAPATYRQAAEKIAAIHRNEDKPMTVAIVEPEKIYNEFSSGSPDVGGIRRFLKMLYDRGEAGMGNPLRYVLLFGRTSIDTRGITPDAPTYPVIPSWMPAAVRASLSDVEGFCTDDITAMLSDGSGADLYRDKLSVAIARIPATSAEEAGSIADKIAQYAAGTRKTAWKQRFLFLADDGDEGEHLKQTEKMISKFQYAERQQHLVKKVYIDAFELVGNETPAAREAMHRYLDEGVVWWNFIGHAHSTGWTSEGILTYSDINTMYLRHWPFIYAATCDFLRLDGAKQSGAELLFKVRHGGAIGIIAAVRPVYISSNAMFSNAIGRALAMRDDQGLLLRPGDIYRIAKNDIRDKNDKPCADDNRLRYSFIGDPAMRLATPSNIARIESINGIPVGGNEQITIAALEKAGIKGSVTSPDGTVLENFNGTLLVEIFDAERTFTTLGHHKDGTKDPFEDYGERIYCGSAKVVGGRFEFTAAMPAEISQNFRPATMSLFAYAADSDNEAAGLCRDFYVYGYDENAAPDTNPPTIDSFVLNHSSFRSGDTVNDSPMLIAAISDDTGINVSTAGIGRQMTALLDNKTSLDDLSFYYTPSADGSPAGVINYPLENLEAGAHTLSLRIWDTAGNPANAYIEFFVNPAEKPKIYDVYTDANPASTQANFYLSHDRPDAMINVEISVYDLLGRPLWSKSANGRSDMFLSMPVSWDLTDNSGRRVPRGIYLYRARISTDGQNYETGSRKIAVTAP